MIRSLAAFALATSLAVAGCSGGSVNTPDSGGGTMTPYDAGPDIDSGPILHDPNLADTFGPFTGAFDVNGAGELLAIQVDGDLALMLNDPEHPFIGTYDAGHFSTRTVLPDQEDCGVNATIIGIYELDGGYAANQVLCAAGAMAMGPLAGNRFVYPNVYKQDLAWSGAYDTIETVAPGNACAIAAGTHHLRIGVAKDRDAGTLTAALFGDGLREELVFGSLDDATGVISATAKDSSGNDTSTFTLFYIADGGVSGARSFLADAGGPCPAQMQYFGTKR